MSVTVGNIQFKTKAQLREHVKGLLKRIGQCESLHSKDPATFQFLLSLFERHPNPIKSKNVIDVAIKHNPCFKNLEFVLIKQDGTTDDISYKVCVDNRMKDCLKVAMRTAIVDQILEFKYSQPLLRCAVCSKAGSEYQYEVDHVVWFDKLCAEFMSEFSDQFQGKIPTHFNDNEAHVKCFRGEDCDFEKAWQTYHRERADLRILCANCNRSREKYKKITKDATV